MPRPAFDGELRFPSDDAQRTGKPHSNATLESSRKPRRRSDMSNVLFNGVDANGMNGLWVSDGSALGTHELAVFGTGAGPTDMAVLYTNPNVRGGAPDMVFNAENSQHKQG